MCYSPLWRLPIEPCFVPKRLMSKGYKNGAFIVAENRKNELIEKALICANLNKVDPNTFINNIQQVPCGQCQDCRIKRSKEWAQRIILESQEYEHNYFITLTYDDDHLIDNIEWSVSRLDGELGFTPFLNKNDFILFKKRLLERMRYKYGHSGIRFFQCGEYGSKNGRPHFHAIFFNLPIPDLELVKSVSLGGKSYCYYKSKMLEECWQKGFVMIGEVSWESASYVARYVVKKFHSEGAKAYSELCNAYDVPEQPGEFINMSRCPGIARRYYDENKDEFYKNDNIVLPNGRAVQPARYFDKLFDIEFPEELANIKDERKRLAQLRQLNKYYGMSAEQRQASLEQEIESKQRALKKLVRPL